MTVRDGPESAWVIPGLPYILVYQVRHDDELVIVMAVFDGAQDR
jgi:hypothetical protein